MAANALHFVRRGAQPAALAHLAGMLEPGGRIVIVEYDRDRGSRWVPYPISRERLRRIALEAGLPAPVSLVSTPSDFGGEIYSASIATR